MRMSEDKGAQKGRTADAEVSRDAQMPRKEKKKSQSNSARTGRGGMSLRVCVRVALTSAAL